MGASHCFQRLQLDLRPSKTIDYKGELRLLHQHSRALSHARDRTLYETCTQLGLGVGLVGWHDDEPNVIEVIAPVLHACTELQWHAAKRMR